MRVTLVQSLALTPGQRLTVRYLPVNPSLVEFRKGECADCSFPQTLLAADAVAAGAAILIFGRVGSRILPNPCLDLDI